MLAEECHIEQRWLRRCFSGGPDFSLLSPPHLKKMMARSPGSSSAHLPNAWGWSSCPEPDLHYLHCPRMEVEVVEEEVQEKVGADPPIYRVSFQHCQVPFQVICPSLEASSPF